MSHDAGQVCRCTVNHLPAPLEFFRHHIWPAGMGGPDADWNYEWLCPTAHANVHELLRAMVKERNPIPLWEFSSLYDVPVSRFAHRVALVGYRRWSTNLTGGDPQAVLL